MSDLDVVKWFLLGVFGLVFGGYFSLEDWVVSFNVWEEMKVNCGFVKGLMFGLGMGYDFDEED